MATDCRTRPPVKPALEPTPDASAASAADLARAADAAYQGRRWADCASLYDRLAEKPAGPSTDPASHLYSAACCYAMGGDADRAFERLAAAAREGWMDAEHMNRDSDLEALRTDRRWEEAVHAAQLNQAKLLEDCRAKGPATEPVNVDLFGSAQVSLDRILAERGACFQALLEATGRKRRILQSSLAGWVRGLGDFAYAELSVVQYYSPKPGTYLTIDLVDSGDRGRRMSFSPAPTDRFEDPEGLLAKWAEYEAKGWALQREGKLHLASGNCPGFHCLFGFESAELEPYARLFSDGVSRHHELLARILHESASDEQRGQAAFLLGHHPDAGQMVAALLPAFRDPSALVRNNAMRVISFFAWQRPEADIPVGPVIEALSFPAATDRNKALAILSSLARKPENHAVITRSAGDLLLQVLRLKQPNNHDFAYSTLKAISGKEFGERDFAAWEAWLAEARR
jgi:hypothetical protein